MSVNSSRISIRLELLKINSSYFELQASSALLYLIIIIIF